MPEPISITFAYDNDIDAGAETLLAVLRAPRQTDDRPAPKDDEAETAPAEESERAA